MANKSLPKKIIKKARRILSKIVPYNIKYKPAGIVNISKNSTVDDIEFLEVNPPSSLKLDHGSLYRRLHALSQTDYDNQLSG
jgi:hypothetical protein